MSSLASLRTFLRSTSDNHGNQSGSATCSPMSPMRSFPSMDDFSCGASRDAEERDAANYKEPEALLEKFERLHRGASDAPSVPSARRSSIPMPIGQPTLVGRYSLDATQFQSAARPDHNPAPFGPSSSFHHHHHRTPAMSIPQIKSSTRSPDVQPPPRPLANTVSADSGLQNDKEGKIDGMDYYGWCELLRSSSL